MQSVTDRVGEIVAELNGVGIRCTVSTPVPSPPCAVLRMPALMPAGNSVGVCTSRAVVWELYLVSKGSSDWVSWQRLDGMVAECFALWGPSVRSCTPETYPLDAETDAPAYRLTWEELI